MLYFLIVICIILFLILQYQKRLTVISTVNLFLFFYIAVLIFTSIYHFFIKKSDRINLFRLESLYGKYFNEGLQIILLMLLYFMIGCLFYLIFSKKARIVNNTKINLFDFSTENINYSFLVNIAILISIISFICTSLYFGGLNQLFYRSDYLLNERHIFKTIYSILLVFSSAIAGICIRKKFISSTITFFCAMLIGFGTGSRLMIIYFICFITAFILLTKNKKKRFFLFLLFIPSFFIFSGIVVALRKIGDGYHGIIPYFGGIFKHSDIIIENIFFNFYYTFIFGFYAIIGTLKKYTFADYETLWISLNPMFGNFTGWYDITYKMRLNFYAPFSGIGELARYPVFSSFYFFFCGIYLSYLDKKIRTYLIKKSYAYPIIIYLLIVFFIIQFYEYNLRAAHRYLIYTLIITFIFYLIEKINPIKIKHTK